MRHLIRLSAGMAAFGALMALMTTMAVAGNFAEVTMIEGSDVPPVAGENREFRFSLLQHGVTPVDHGRVALTGTLPATNERISVEATSAGGGEWIATVAFPVEGDWQLRITHSIFETPEPSTLTVGPAAGFAWLQGVSWLSGLALAVAAILGTLLLIGRARRPSAAEAKTTAVRAG